MSVKRSVPFPGTAIWYRPSAFVICATVSPTTRTMTPGSGAPPCVVTVPVTWRGVEYVSGEGRQRHFGGNSNWRGPVWFPLNYLLVEALERYHHFYGAGFLVECPRGSGRLLTLNEVARELDRRLASIFMRGADGRRPCNGDDARYADDPAWRELLDFHEYFDADSGRGLGASHQTGWTGLITDFLYDTAGRDV
jgi:hypothetical protein